MDNILNAKIFQRVGFATQKYEIRGILQEKF